MDIFNSNLPSVKERMRPQDHSNVNVVTAPAPELQLSPLCKDSEEVTSLELTRTAPW